MRGIQRELTSVLRKDSRARARRIRAAVLKSAKQTQQYIAQNTIPIAFSELVDSLYVSDSKIIADAPHAEAVERGSRPHKPPLEPLIRWVKLRGMQGLKTSRQLKRAGGSTTGTQARTVAQMIRAMKRNGATPVNAPEQIARAIQAAIMKRGTKPHTFMWKALPFAGETLFENVSEAVPDK